MTMLEFLPTSKDIPYLNIGVWWPVQFSTKIIQESYDQVQTDAKADDTFMQGVTV